MLDLRRPGLHYGPRKHFIFYLEKMGGEAAPTGWLMRTFPGNPGPRLDRLGPTWPRSPDGLSSPHLDRTGPARGWPSWV